jgi:hypothetical protein
VRWHLREAKRKGFDWERIYQVATTARPEGSRRRLILRLYARQSIKGAAVENDGVVGDWAR